MAKKQQQLAKKPRTSQKAKAIVHQQQATIKQGMKPKKGTTKQRKVNSQHTSIVGKPWSQIQVELRQQILDSLVKSNYTTMFPVQQAAIPLLLKNYDLAVEAQTGSGKTLSFLIPLLQKYLGLNDPWKCQQNQEQISKIRIKYLLVSPTRQLCQQSYSSLLKLLNCLPNQQRAQVYKKYCYCATGGSQLEEDIQKIQNGVYVLMGTVGRLRQIGQIIGEEWLKKVDYLFIDEADRVLKEKGVQELIKSIQKMRRTALFSATLQSMQPKHYQFFGMRNLAKISLKAIDTSSKACIQNQIEKAKGYVIPKSLHNTYIVMKDRLQKISFLISFLQQRQGKAKIIVFLSTCACVDYYTKLLEKYFEGKNCIYGIHGKLKTRRRKTIIESFLQRESGVLFATDVVSRGIDFQHIHFILQVDPPEDPDNYIHRIGRTARVNRPGTAILLIEQHQEPFITFLSDKGVGVVKVEKKQFISSQISNQYMTQRFYEIITTDRDNVQKGKKAFVSYVRAYKEHDLRYIFQFKNVDIGMIAHSFFLFRMPRVKQILGKGINSFKQSTIDIESIPWLDKNQETQFQAKQQHRDELRQARQNTKVAVDIKNIKSRRKKVRRQNQMRQMKEMNKDHKQILKSRKSNKLKAQLSSQSQNFDEDTQQIEQRVSKKHTNQ